MMGRAERQKGSRAELAVVKYLKENGYEAQTTRAANGTRRGDDIIVDAPLSIEVKDHGRMDLSGWLRQAEENAGDRVPVVWHKKRGKSNPSEWYVTMSGESLMRLLDVRQ
jgi:hypothetical protein